MARWGMPAPPWVLLRGKPKGTDPRMDDRVIEHHRRMAVRCPGCGTRVVAAPPPAATGTPFGPRLHALATYLNPSYG